MLDRYPTTAQRASNEHQWRIETVRRIPDVDLEGVRTRSDLGRDDSNAEATTAVDGSDALELRG